MLIKTVGIRWVLFVIGIMMLAVPRMACGQEVDAQVAHQTAAELFPASTIFYAEIPQPQKLVALVKEHPLRAKLEAMPEYKQVVKDPNYHKFQLGVAVFEAKMALPWDEALTAIAEVEFTFASMLKPRVPPCSSRRTTSTRSSNCARQSSS